MKTVEAVKWIQNFHPGEGYYLPTHLERAGAFKQSGNSGFDVNDLRDFNNAAPAVAFGFETQPGHHASGDRGEYSLGRQTDDSIGGTTWGGTGIYGALVGGVWDAMLGEGRGYWFFASSDWHNRGSFSADDRRSTADFLPGEYQRAYSLARNNSARLNPQFIVDAMRSGNSFSTMGQLIDRLSFVACASYPGLTARSNALVESWAVAGRQWQHRRRSAELRCHGREAQGACRRGDRGHGGGARSGRRELRAVYLRQSLAAADWHPPADRPSGAGSHRPDPWPGDFGHQDRGVG